jgi:hypothetical protein
VGQTLHAPPFFRSLFRRQSRHRGGRFLLPGRTDIGFRARLIEHAGQIEHTIESPVPKLFIGVMLYDVIIANQQIGSIHDSFLKAYL